MANTEEPTVINTANEMVYQFKITLKYKRPPVWRRIQVPGYFSFEALHLAIQQAMGWSNSHLHMFTMNGKSISGDPTDDECFDTDETKAFIKDYFQEPKQKAVYEYDFGCSWIHIIVLEKIELGKKDVKYPKCLAGRKACPAEDSRDDDEEDLEEPKRFSPKNIFDNWDNSNFLLSVQ